MSNSLKTAGHLYKKQLENWLSKLPIFNDTANKKVRGIFCHKLLVRVVIQHFLKTIVVQFVFEVIG